jgi:excinuclease ABC subunit A
VCHGKRLKPEALSVTFAGHDIGELSRLPLSTVREVLEPAARGELAPAARGNRSIVRSASARSRSAWRPAAPRMPRRPTCAARPTCRKKNASRRSASRATCWAHRDAGAARPGLPVAGAQHADAVAGRTAAAAPGDAARLAPVRRRVRARRAVGRPASRRWRSAARRALQRLKAAGNSLFVVEHDLAT